MKKLTIIDVDGKTVMDTYLFESEEEKKEFYDAKHQALAAEKDMAISKIIHQYAQDVLKLHGVEENSVVKGSEGIKKLQDWVDKNGHKVLEFMMVMR